MSQTGIESFSVVSHFVNSGILSPLGHRLSFTWLPLGYFSLPLVLGDFTGLKIESWGLLTRPSSKQSYCLGSVVPSQVRRLFLTTCNLTGVVGGTSVHYLPCVLLMSRLPMHYGPCGPQMALARFHAIYCMTLWRIITLAP